MPTATSVKKYTARLAWAVGESGSIPSVCGMNGRTRIDAAVGAAMAGGLGACGRAPETAELGSDAGIAVARLTDWVRHH